MLPSFMRVIAPVAAALAASTLSVPAYATETSFAAYTGLGSSFIATNPGTAGGSLTLKDTSVISFSYLPSDISTLVKNISANLVFNASSANANLSKPAALLGLADQTGFTGSLTIKSINALTIGSTTYAAGSNLLTATFTNATFLGTVGFQDAGLTADTSTGSLIYTSDVLDFTKETSRDYSFSFSAVTPALAIGTISGMPGYIQGFKSTPTGSFASNEAAVPEPASWAMMLVGLGAIGFSIRANTRRKLQAA